MNLNKILLDLQKHKNTDREELLANYIKMRLTTSLTVYYNELDKSISYLNAKNEVRLLKRMNKNKQ